MKFLIFQQADFNIINLSYSFYLQLLLKMKILRQQFIDSSFMRIQLTAYQKKWVHHNRYHLEITLDKQNLKIKKKYSQIKRFSEEVQKNLGVKNITLEPHLRTNDQFKSIQQLVKKLNTQFVEIKPELSEKQKSFRRQVRNYVYNMLFYNDEMNFSDEDQTQDRSFNSSLQSTPSKSSSITNQQKVDKGLKAKSITLASTLVSNVLKKIEVEPMKQIFKNINIVWLKKQNQWHECRLITSQTSLILYNRIQNSKIIIILCKMKVDIIQKPYQKIVLSHFLLSEPLEFRLSNLNQNFIDQQNPQLLNKYIAFYSILKSLCHKQRMIQIFNFVKIKLTMNRNLRKISSTSSTSKQIALKLIHNLIISAFTIFPQTSCEIIVPITSNYGVLQFFITEVKQHGVVPNFKQNIQNFSVPVQNIYDTIYNQKPKRKTQIKQINLQTKNGTLDLSLQYFQAGTRESYYCYDSQNDKFEGNIQFDEPNKDQVRIQFNRLKRIVWTIEQYASFFKDLANFANPIFSYIFYTLLVLLIIFVDLNYIVHYSIISMILLMLYNHPSFQLYLKQIAQYTNYSSQYVKLKSLLTLKLKNHSSGSIEQFNNSYPVNLMLDLQKARFLENFQFTMKKKRNIYKKYKRLQQILVKGQNCLMEIVNYLQKVKNIFTWYHHKKTKLVYIGFFIALFVITFVPIRFALLIAVYKMFKKGKLYSKKTKQYNERVISEIYWLTVKQNKLDDKIMQLIKQDTKIIPKKDSDYQTFQKKLKQNLQTILGIQFSPQIFQISRTIKDSKKLLSLCKKRYKIPLLTCRKYELSDQYAYQENSMGKVIRIILGFISIIPSDRNILGVKTPTEQPQVQSQKYQIIEEAKEDVDDD